MAELATIARPYAEALFKAVGRGDQAQAIADQLSGVGQLVAQDVVRQFVDNPKVSAAQVLELIASAVGRPLDGAVRNLLDAMLDNDRLPAIGAVAEQYRRLVNDAGGVADAHIYSAFALSADELASVAQTLERRFGRKLRPLVQIDESLIGGVRVVVGDEVLDTSVKARLDNMKAALLA